MAFLSDLVISLMTSASLIKKHNKKHPSQGNINKYFFVLFWFLASSRQKIETETLRGGVDFHEVCLSVVETPHHFYVQKADSQKE